MKTANRWLGLLVLMVFTCHTHAAAPSGIARFQGSIVAPASASTMPDTLIAQARIQRRSVDGLDHARVSLHSDVLDYFATYASRSAALVSVSYR